MRPERFTRRSSWAAAPVALRERVARVCGAAVVSSVDVHGGMSPGPAAVLSLADGRRVFVKAVARQVSAGSHRLYEREAVTLASLPARAPAPVLLGSADADGWLALVMTFVAGEPAGPPWTSGGVRLVAAACAAVAQLRAPAGVPAIGEFLVDLDGWQKMDRPDVWETRHRAALARLAADWPDWTAGTALVHQDVRADNAIVDHAAGRATLVDWSFGCAGAGWLDRARLAADIVGSGHRDGPAAALGEALSVLAALPGEPQRFVAALAGMWRYRSTLPAPSGLPMLRRWQRGRALAVRPLLAAFL